MCSISYHTSCTDSFPREGRGSEDLLAMVPNGSVNSIFHTLSDSREKMEDFDSSSNTTYGMNQSHVHRLIHHIEERIWYYSKTLLKQELSLCQLHVNNSLALNVAFYSYAPFLGLS